MAITQASMTHQREMTAEADAKRGAIDGISNFGPMPVPSGWQVVHYDGLARGVTSQLYPTWYDNPPISAESPGTVLLGRYKFAAFLRPDGTDVAVEVLVFVRNTYDVQRFNVTTEFAVHTAGGQAGATIMGGLPDRDAVILALLAMGVEE